jgi:hypothetical protein
VYYIEGKESVRGERLLTRFVTHTCFHLVAEIPNIPQVKIQIKSSPSQCVKMSDWPIEVTTSKWNENLGRIKRN